MLPGGTLVLSLCLSACGVMGRQVFKSVGFLPGQFGQINVCEFGGRNWFGKPWRLGEVEYVEMVDEIGGRNPLLDNSSFRG